MGLSRRAYARHRGVSEAAVRKAIAAGRSATGQLLPLQCHLAGCLKAVLPGSRARNRRRQQNSRPRLRMLHHWRMLTNVLVQRIEEPRDPA